MPLLYFRSNVHMWKRKVKNFTFCSKDLQCFVLLAKHTPRSLIADCESVIILYKNAIESEMSKPSFHLMIM